MERIAKFHKVSMQQFEKDWSEAFPEVTATEIQRIYEAVSYTHLGYPVNDDVLAGCTINVKSLMDAAKNAKDNAK